MPRWRRKRREQEEEPLELRSEDDLDAEEVATDSDAFELAEAHDGPPEELSGDTREQPAAEAAETYDEGTPGESEEWPEWAYEERRSRRRKGRRSRRGGGRRASDAATYEEPAPLFDQTQALPDPAGAGDEVEHVPAAGPADALLESTADKVEPDPYQAAEPDDLPGETVYDALEPAADEAGSAVDYDVPGLASDEPAERGVDELGLGSGEALESAGDVPETEAPDVWTRTEEDTSVRPVWSPEGEQRLREVGSSASAEDLDESAPGVPAETGRHDPYAAGTEADPFSVVDPLTAPEFETAAPFDAASIEFLDPAVEPAPAVDGLQEYDPPRLDQMPSGWPDERSQAEPAYGNDAEAYADDFDDGSYDDRYEYGYDDDYDQEDEDRRSYQPVVGDVLPGGLGPRRAALHERRRKRRKVSAAILLAAALAAGILGVSVFAGGDDEGDDDERDRSGAPIATGDDSVETMLLFGTKEDATETGAVWLTLLSIDTADNTGSVVYMPSHIAVEVPGRGLLPLGESYGTEDIPLLLVSTESLLGIEIDRYLEMSDRDARVLFDAVGGLPVDVPGEVTVPAGSGQARLLFPEGEQQLDGEALADLLFVKGIEGDDVELGSRHLAFWDSLFETFAERTEELEAAILESSAALGESDRSTEENADYIGDLASLPEASVVFNSLPVEEAAVGQEELYSVNDEEVQAFVRDTIGARITQGDEIRVQILNGNGVPGIGAEVAEKLGAEDYRVILAGNARRLNYKKTLIIAYDRSSEGIDRAERARELIGVGEVQVSAQDQGIVDLTIVVGKDFLGRT